MNQSPTQFSETLTKLGLTPNEAKIYELLLTVGPSGIKSILFHTGLKRGNAYYHLEGLEKRGLVEKQDLPGKPIAFLAKQPDQLEILLAQQKTALNNAGYELSQNLPKLNSLYQLLATRPGVKFYQGKEGMEQVYEQLLALRKPIDSFEDKGEMAALIPDYAKEFINKRIKYGIFNRVIAPSANPINKTDQKELRETRLVPTAKFPFRMDVKICSDMVSLITFQKQNPVAVLVQNREIAENFKLLFEFVWSLLAPTTGMPVLRQPRA